MSLQDWGAWAAIIAAVITLLVVIVSVTRWGYRRWRFRCPLVLATSRTAGRGSGQMGEWSGLSWGDSTVGQADLRIGDYGYTYVTDAFGQTRTLEQIKRWPKSLAKGEDLSLARNVTTVAPWEGTLVLKARLRSLDHANSKVHPVEISFRALAGEREG